jgi:hypothetical protein
MMCKLTRCTISDARKQDASNISGFEIHYFDSSTSLDILASMIGRVWRETEALRALGFLGFVHIPGPVAGAEGGGEETREGAATNRRGRSWTNRREERQGTSVGRGRG